MSDIHEYSGDDIDVTWDRRLCIHVGECGRAQGDLFEAGRKPWCEPDLVEIGTTRAVVGRCPTGALAYTNKDGSPGETHAKENRIQISNQGPLYLTGELEIDGATPDMVGAKFRAALCRCGGSARKPFCDNAHEKNGFVDRGAIGESGDGFEAPGGLLKIRRVKNGPLLVSGNVSIVASSGRVAWTGTKAALCRCGQSNNRPFCDGSHKAAGFEAE